MSLSDIRNMSLEERLHLMEQLWDSFKYEDQKVAPPAWHKNVLEEQLKQYREGKIELLSIEKLKHLL